MITYTLIGAERCPCGAVVFHVHVCPMCRERIEHTALRSLVPPPYVSPEPPVVESGRSEKSRHTVQWIAESKARKLRAGEAVKKIRAERAAQKEKWATEYLKRNEGSL